MPGQEECDTDQTAYTVRGTVAPINREVNGVNQVVHLGGSFRHRDTGKLRECGAAECFDDDGDVTASGYYQYRAKGADLHLADRFVDTPSSAEQTTCSSSKRRSCGDRSRCRASMRGSETNGAPPFEDADVLRVSPTYDGWYVDASWYLTGETRNYEASTGEFGRTKVKNPVYGGSGGWGAWQIAGRYDVIDLSDKGAAMAAAYGLQLNAASRRPGSSA